MNTKDKVASLDDPTNQPLVNGPSAHGLEAPRHQAKAGIGGCLLYPLIFLVAQPLLFVYMLLTSRKSPLPMVTYRIVWPYMIYDLALLGAVALLFIFFVRKKAILPALFVLFLVVFSVLSGLLADTLGRLPETRVTGRDPLQSHLVTLFQCLLLIPYFALDRRVKNTFVRELDDRDSIDRLVKPIAAPAERLYGWLARRGKMVFVVTVAFVVGVFVFDWVVDSIVLNFFLR